MKIFCADDIDRKLQAELTKTEEFNRRMAGRKWKRRPLVSGVVLNLELAKNDQSENSAAKVGRDGSTRG